MLSLNEPSGKIIDGEKQARELFYCIRKNVAWINTV